VLPRSELEALVDYLLARRRVTLVIDDPVRDRDIIIRSSNYVL